MKFREIINEFPKYLDGLKKHLFKYTDKNIEYLKKFVAKVFYFKEGLTEDNFFDIIYKMKPKIFDIGTTVLKQFDDANKMYFVLKGVIEVYTD